MGSKTSIDAPEPDPNIGLAQKELSELSRRQMDFWEQDIWPGLKEQSAQQQKLSEEQVGINKETQRRQTAIAEEQFGLNMESQRRQMAIAEEQYQRYKNTFEPLQNEIIADAQAYDTEANRERIAGEAMGDVSTQFEIQRQNEKMRAAQYGIDPTSGRYRGMSEASNINEAATKASAATRARTAAEQLGWAKKMDAIGLGSGIFGNQATAMGLALNAGNSAVGNQATATGLSMNAGNAAIGAGQVPISNYGAMGNSLTGSIGSSMGGWSSVGQLGVGKYNADVNAYSAQQQAAAAGSAGLGSALGSIAGTAASLYTGGQMTAAIKGIGSDIRLKEHIEIIGTLPNGLTIYEFEYKPEFKDSILAGHGRFRGLMAHEVERVIPQAVITTASGYKAVDYSMVI